MLQPSNDRRKIIVIGAGIIGSCCALQLLRDGHHVTLVDREEPGSGCSFGNAAAISPAAVVPMALPGMIKKVPKWLFDPEGPLSVKWHYLPKVAPWLARWVLASRASVATRASYALHALNSGTLVGYRQLLTPSQFQEHIHPSGHLYVWRKRPAGVGDVLVQALREAHGVRTEALDADQLRQLEPRLGPDIKAGLLLPDNSQTRNPKRLVEAVVSNFLAEGGVLLRDDVCGLKRHAREVTTVVTRTGSLNCDVLLVAAGAFSRLFKPELARGVPLETERGYHMMLLEPNIMPQLPIMFADFKFYATPLDDGLRLAGTVEFSGLDAAPNWQRAELLLKHAERVLPGIKGCGSTVWMGRRPSIPDSVPVIDRSPDFDNVFLAFGHGHLGMSGGPGTSRLISDLINGREPFIAPAPYSSERFGLRGRQQQRPANKRRAVLEEQT